MDDAFTLGTAFLDSLRPPFHCTGGQTHQLASPAAACSMCTGPLIEIEFTRHFVLVCDNWRCLAFRRPQGSRAKPTTETWPSQAMGIFWHK